MKKLTIEKIESRIELQKKKHAAREVERFKEAQKHKYTFTPIKFSLPIKWMTRLKVFKNKNNVFNPIEMKAVSYDWWVYLKVIRGKLVFNNYSYSNTTRNHQWDLKNLLDKLGVRIDAEVSVREGLQEFESKALQPVYDAIFTHEVNLTNPRRKKSDDAWKKKQIQSLKHKVKLLRSLGAKMNKEDVKKLRESIFTTETKRREEMEFNRRETLRLKKLNKTTTEVFNPLPI